MITVREADWDDPLSVRLRAEQRAEIEARYEGLDAEPGPVPTAADMTSFYVALDGDVPVGCGGLRAIDTQHGEIKRMYVVPTQRGSGAAGVILTGLEDAARALGWERLVLETGRLQPDAVRFYEKHGYTPIPQYGPYIGSDDSLCFKREL